MENADWTNHWTSIEGPGPPGEQVLLYLGVARGGPEPLPIEMLPMIKMSQKRLLFLQFQFFFSIFAYNSN